MVNIGDIIECLDLEDANYLSLALKKCGYEALPFQDGKKVLLKITHYNKHMKHKNKNAELDVIVHEAKMHGMTYGEYMKHLEVEKRRKERANEISKRKREERKYKNGTDKVK